MEVSSGFEERTARMAYVYQAWERRCVHCSCDGPEAGCRGSACSSCAEDVRWERNANHCALRRA